MGTILYDEDWFSHEHLTSLETFIGKDYTCAVSNVQTAVQACMELLGTRTDVVPVVLPVTIPPDTLAGVLRAGAHPLLLDIDEQTLQMDAGQLKDTIEILEKEGNTPIVVFNRPFGDPVSPKLLDLVLDLPSIVDSRILPHLELDKEDIPCVFNIFDLTPICGGGAIVIHAFPNQVKQLKQVRSGPMGLAGALSEPQAKMALEKLKHFGNIFDTYISALQPFSSIDVDQAQLCGACNNPGIVWLKVPNAKQLVDTLCSYGIQAAIGLYPVCNLEEVKCRFSQEPSYPVAAKLENRFVCIPADKDVIKKVIEVL